MNEPESWASRLHCLTDLTKMLTVIVEMSPNKEVWITREMVQDIQGANLYLESSFDTATLRLTTRRNTKLVGDGK